MQGANQAAAAARLDYPTHMVQLPELSLLLHPPYDFCFRFVSDVQWHKSSRSNWTLILQLPFCKPSPLTSLNALQQLSNCVLLLPLALHAPSIKFTPVVLSATLSSLQPPPLAVLNAVQSGLNCVLPSELRQVGQVGRDGNADFLRSSLSECGVSLDHLATVDGPSGSAVIFLFPDGKPYPTDTTRVSGLLVTCFLPLWWH